MIKQWIRLLFKNPEVSGLNPKLDMVIVVIWRRGGGCHKEGGFLKKTMQFENEIIRL